MTLGKSPEEVDADQPSDEDVMAALGFGNTFLDLDVDADSTANVHDKTLADLIKLVKRRQQTIDRLAQRVEILEATVDDLQTRVAEGEQTQKKLAKDMTDAGTKADEATEIAKSASAVAQQARAVVKERTSNQQSARENTLPGDVKPASSPLDFLANCRLHKVRRRYKEEANRTNTYRAVTVARQWEDYATKRTNGRGIFWTRDDLEQALIEVMGEKPHRQTITRVWEILSDLGGDTVREKTRQVSRTQDPDKILEMSRSDADALLDNRYTHLDLLDEISDTALTSGVTPVVTGGDSE